MKKRKWLSNEEYATLMKKREEMKKKQEDIKKMKFEARSFMMSTLLDDLTQLAKEDPHYAEVKRYAIEAGYYNSDFYKRPLTPHKTHLNPC